MQETTGESAGSTVQELPPQQYTPSHVQYVASPELDRASPQPVLLTQAEPLRASYSVVRAWYCSEISKAMDRPQKANNKLTQATDFWLPGSSRCMDLKLTPYSARHVAAAKNFTGPDVHMTSVLAIHASD